MSRAIDRRTFLAAVPGVGLAACAAARRRPLDGFGVQLYTLRSVIADDVEGTFAALADMGYRTVEFAGLYGLTPRQMRARLDATGLRAASSHHSMEDVRTGWARTLDGARELGQDLVVIPSLPGDERSPESLRRIADELNRAGEAARGAGLRLGYHNHDWELAPLGSETRSIDLLLEHTEPDLVDWQMDIFWTVHGGGDPAAYLRTVGRRITSVHVKDRTADGRMVDVGAGVIDFAALLRQAEGQALLHAFVEHDEPGDDPLASVRRSLEHLRRLGV